MAGVSHAILAYVLSGDRRATPAVATAVARALEAIGHRAASAAARLRSAVARGEP